MSGSGPTSNKGSTSQNQTVRADPYAQAFARDMMQQTRDRMGGMPETPGYYPGDPVSDMNFYQHDALQEQYGGMGGTSQENAFGGYLNNQLNQTLDPTSLQNTGDQLMGGLGVGQMALAQNASGEVNPLVDQMFQAAAGNMNESFQEAVMPGINASFGQAGRTGSGLHADAMGNAAGELADAQAQLAANMYGGAAESALNRQLQAGQALQSGALGGMQAGSGLYGTQGALQQGAAGMVRDHSELGHVNVDRALGAGDRYQDQAQNEVNADMDRYQHEASRGIQDYQRWMESLGMASQAAAPVAGTGTTDSKSTGGSKGGG